MNEIPEPVHRPDAIREEDLSLEDILRVTSYVLKSIAVVFDELEKNEIPQTAHPQIEVFLKRIGAYADDLESSLAGRAAEARGEDALYSEPPEMIRGFHEELCRILDDVVLLFVSREIPFRIEDFQVTPAELLKRMEDMDNAEAIVEAEEGERMLPDPFLEVAKELAMSDSLPLSMREAVSELLDEMDFLNDQLSCLEQNAGRIHSQKAEIFDAAHLLQVVSDLSSHYGQGHKRTFLGKRDFPRFGPREFTKMTELMKKKLFGEDFQRLAQLCYSDLMGYITTKRSLLIDNLRGYITTAPAALGALS